MEVSTFSKKASGFVLRWVFHHFSLKKHSTLCLSHSTLCLRITTCHLLPHHQGLGNEHPARERESSSSSRSRSPFSSYLLRSSPFDAFAGEDSTEETVTSTT